MNQFYRTLARGVYGTEPSPEQLATVQEQYELFTSTRWIRSLRQAHHEEQLGLIEENLRLDARIAALEGKLTGRPAPAPREETRRLFTEGKLL